MTDKEIAVELCKAILSNPGFSDKAGTKSVIEYVTTIIRDLNKNFPDEKPLEKRCLVMHDQRMQHLKSMEADFAREIETP